MIATLPRYAFVLLCIVASLVGGLFFLVFAAAIDGIVSPATKGFAYPLLAGGMLLAGLALPVILLVRQRNTVNQQRTDTPTPNIEPNVEPEKQMNTDFSVSQSDDPEAVWHYTQRGAKVGPVTRSHLIQLRSEHKIDADTHVWKKGMRDWLPFNQSELGATADVPPPLQPQLINNGIVWIVAFLPLILAIIDASLAEMSLQQAWMSGQSPLVQRNGLLVLNKAELPWYVTTVLYSGLCFWDERQLEKAGYGSRYLPAIALLLVPVYLFVRAQRLGQTPYYGFVWIVCLIVAVVFS